MMAHLLLCFTSSSRFLLFMLYWAQITAKFSTSGGYTVDFAYSEKVQALQQQISNFMDRYIYPNLQTYHEQIAASGNPHHHAEIIDELKVKAREQGLWNLFLPDEEYGAGLSNLE